MSDTHEFTQGQTFPLKTVSSACILNSFSLSFLITNIICDGVAENMDPKTWQALNKCCILFWLLKEEYNRDVLGKD